MGATILFLAWAGVILWPLALAFALWRGLKRGRGPGREHIAIQSYMLALIAGLGALYALILAAAPVRDFFEMELLSSVQWFLAMFAAAVGLTIASILWRLPQIERLEAPVEDEGAPELGGTAA